MSVQPPGHYQPSRHGPQLATTINMARLAAARMLSQAAQFRETLTPAARAELQAAAHSARAAANAADRVKRELDGRARPQGRPRKVGV